MESRTFYVRDESGLVPYDYNELYHAIHNGTISINKKILVYDNLTREKQYMTPNQIFQ